MEPSLEIVSTTPPGIRGTVFPFIVLAIAFVIVLALDSYSYYLVFSCDTRFLMLWPKRL